MKVYAIVAVWGNTKNNHAGMYYLAKELKEAFGKHFVIIPTPTKGSRFLFPLYRIYNFIIALWLRIIVKRNDIVFLMEYLLSETEQSDIARVLRGKCDVRGIAHLVPHRLEKEYKPKVMLKKINYLNKLYVLGSSLKEFLVAKGVDEEKIIVTFHYVDNNYYRPGINKNQNLTVICMGNMERDYDILYGIIKGNPKVEFIICKGNMKYPNKFNVLPNLKMYGFLPEVQLLKLMQQSDVSLNVMKDTIGSNVITTSLACGLTLIASNVGSILDYITDGKEGFLFNQLEECSKYLHELQNFPISLQEMKSSALKRSEELSLNNFTHWFKKEFYCGK